MTFVFSNNNYNAMSFLIQLSSSNPRAYANDFMLFIVGVALSQILVPQDFNNNIYGFFYLQVLVLIGLLEGAIKSRLQRQGRKYSSWSLDICLYFKRNCCFSFFFSNTYLSI